MSDAKPTVLCLVNGVLREQLFHPATVARIEAVASIRWLSDDASSRNPDTWRVERNDVSIVLGSWGMPNFDNILLDTLPGLRLIAHGAGTVKGFVTPEVFERGIRVTHGAVVIAAAVGEWCLMATLSGLRLAMSFHESMRAGAWKSSHEGHGNELAGKRVGLIAMSQTARAFLRLLAPFGCEIGVYDPYLSDEAASSLGVRKVAQSMTCARGPTCFRTTSQPHRRPTGWWGHHNSHAFVVAPCWSTRHAPARSTRTPC